MSKMLGLKSEHAYYFVCLTTHAMKKLVTAFFVTSALLLTTPAAYAAEATGEQTFNVRLEWGRFNPDGTPSTTPVSPSEAVDFTGDVSFQDSIAHVEQTVNFERGEDAIDLSTINSTFVGFRSRIVKATDGIVFNVTANFSESTSPSLYFHVQHEGRNVTLSLAELLAGGRFEYVIDSEDRFKLYISLVSE